METAPGHAQCSCGWQGHLRDATADMAIPPMQVPYVSIDLETTGIDPDYCQILEFGAVYDAWSKPVRDLPRFHRYIAWDRVYGEPYAMQMNAAILKKIACREAHDQHFVKIEDLFGQFQSWLYAEMLRDGFTNVEKITPSGKNFASFDLPFLRKQGFDKLFKHRTLDPAPLYLRADDKQMPDTKKCLERAGLPPVVAHTALEDALAVVELVRIGFARFFKILGTSEPVLRL